MVSLVTAADFVIDWGVNALPPRWSAGGNYGWGHRTSWHNTHHDGDVLFCRSFDLSPQAPTPAECLRAIEMIPSGPNIDPDYIERFGGLNHAKPVSFTYDKRKYAIPTSFRWSRVMVVVICTCSFWAGRRWWWARWWWSWRGWPGRGGSGRGSCRWTANLFGHRVCSN